MNEYRYEDLSIGDTECFTYKVTEGALRAFLGMTGDVNPLHTEKDFAAAHGFHDRVVYGFLAASLMSTLGGVYLPGKYCIIHQIESCKFLRPVYVGDRLTIKGTVKEMHEAVRQMAVKVEITNQNNEKIIRAVLKAGFLE